MRYLPSLDGLRAVAILSVMAYHFMPRTVMGGAFGVDIFFVLSGWLITSTLAAEIERSGTVDYRGFLARRARRLMPAFAVLLLAYLALIPLVYPPLAGRRWYDVATAALYLTNLRENFWPADTPLSHSWSLAIEQQFYLVWPFALMALLRLSRHQAALLLWTAWVAISAARFAVPAFLPWVDVYFFSPFHASGLLLGAAIALRPISVKHGGAALLILILLMAASDIHANFLHVLPLIEIAAALVIADPPRILARQPLRVLGKISYGIYLWHIPLGWALPHRTAGEIAVLIALSIGFGWASHIFVEQRFMRTGSSARTVRPLSASTA